MLRTLSRCSELPVVAKQLQKVCNRRMLVTTTTSCGRRLVGWSMLSLLQRQHVAPLVSCSLQHKAAAAALAAKTKTTNYNMCRNYSFFGLFQNAAQSGVQKSNKYATEATIQVQRVSVPPLLTLLTLLTLLQANGSIFLTPTLSYAVT